MPARTGREVIENLAKNPPTLWLDGEQIADPTTHPLTANAAHSLAALYDLQTDPALVDTMTTVSPSSGERVGMSFIVPETVDDRSGARRCIACGPTRRSASWAARPTT